LKHIFFIPCDSHGLQLLIKDLIHLPEFKDIFEKAQVVAKAFKNAPLQYARLHTYQMMEYGKHISLCLAVITRWGTQYRLLNSLLTNKDALRRYIIDYPDELKFSATEYISQLDFWARLEAFRELLKPIDEALRMSESNKSHPGMIIN